MATTALEPLRNRDFRRYWLAGLSANFGWQVQLVAASWLMVQLGGTPGQVALVQAFVALPVMLLSLPGGALTDRFGQRVVVLVAQSFLLAVSVALALCAYAGLLTPMLLLGATLLVGAGRALYYPGWQSMVLQFFPRDRTAAAFAINSGNLNIARSLGPALGGVILATAGAFLAFAAAALSSVSVLAVARRWPRPDPGDNLPPEPMFGAILAGVRYIALSPALLRVTLRAFVFNIGAIAVLALMPLVARDLLNGGPQIYGMLLGAFGAGAVAGALLAEPLRQRLTLEANLAAGFLIFALAMVVLALSTEVLVSGVATTLAGVAWILVQVGLGAANQVASPRWVISRSIAGYQTFVFGGNAIGSLGWGALADAAGTATTLLAAASVLVIGAGLGLLLRIRLPDLAGLDPQTDWVAPDPRIDLAPQSGPILTTITYRIRDEDLPAFLSAMAEKRRNRLRDGAGNWSLSRDILDPMLWFERFRVATWADAQRLHARRTVEGGRVIEAIRALHQGPARPEVQYELVRDIWRRPGVGPFPKSGFDA